MTDWDENDNDTPAIKQMRKMLKEQKKQLDEFQAMKSQFDSMNRSVSVNEALASRGLDPRIAKFYPSDSATDDESVDRWVEENKDLFGTRRVYQDANVNTSVLTEQEQRGYQIQRDIAAYDAALEADLQSKLDKIEYDPMDPEKAQREVLATVAEFGRVTFQ